MPTLVFFLRYFFTVSLLRRKYPALFPLSPLPSRSSLLARGTPFFRASVERRLRVAASFPFLFSRFGHGPVG